MIKHLGALCLILISATLVGAQTPKGVDPERLQVIKQRASVIDPRAREHPEIDFLFADKKGKVLDLQHAVVSSGVEPRGKLVIWLMGYNAPLFERVAGFGYHGIQVHYANKWFG